MTVSHLVPQRLQRAELKLLDRALATIHLSGNLPDTALLEKTPPDHVPLIFRQALEQLRKQRLPLRVARGHGHVQIIHLNFVRIRSALPAPRDQMRRDPQQPPYKRPSLPFKIRQTGQCLMKHLGGNILGLIASRHPPRHKRINAVEVRFIQLREAARIPPCGLDQALLVCRVLSYLQSGLREGRSY